MEKLCIATRVREPWALNTPGEIAIVSPEWIDTAAMPVKGWADDGKRQQDGTEIFRIVAGVGA